MTTPRAIQKSFEAYVPITRGVDEGGRWLLSGPAALVEGDGRGPDYDGDDLVKKAVSDGLTTFMRLGGSVDWEHLYAKSKDPAHLVGKCVGVTPNPDPRGADIVTTELFQDKALAQAAWEHALSGGTLGYSLEGVCKARDPQRSKRITALDIHRMTITTAPKGFEGPRLSVGTPATLGAIVKGLSHEVAEGETEDWESVEDTFDTGDDNTTRRTQTMSHGYDYEDEGGGYEEGGGYGDPGEADQVVVTDSDSVLKALETGVYRSVTDLANSVLPRMVERAVVKAITENDDVKRSIRGIVGGRINKALESLGEPLSKATPGSVPSSRTPRLTGGATRSAQDVIDEATALQERTGRPVAGLSDFVFVKNETNLNTLLKGIASHAAH